MVIYGTERYKHRRKEEDKFSSLFAGNDQQYRVDRGCARYCDRPAFGRTGIQCGDFKPGKE